MAVYFATQRAEQIFAGANYWTEDGAAALYIDHNFSTYHGVTGAIPDNVYNQQLTLFHDAFNISGIASDNGDCTINARVFVDPTTAYPASPDARGAVLLYLTDGTKPNDRWPTNAKMTKSGVLLESQNSVDWGVGASFPIFGPVTRDLVVGPFPRSALATAANKIRLQVDLVKSGAFGGSDVAFRVFELWVQDANEGTVDLMTVLL